MPQGMADEVRLIAKSQFMHQIGAMVLHSPRADMQAFCDLGICFAFSSHLQDLALARR